MITDPRRLLTAGSPYYLTAPAKPPTPKPVRLTLTPAEEVMLEIAAMVDSRTDNEDQKCFQVPRGEQKSMADNLVIAGYLERPNSRAFRYRITELGRQRAKFVQTMTGDEFDLSAYPEGPAETIRQAYRNLKAIMGDLYMQGYLLYHEEGRGVAKGEVAFYNPFRKDFDTYRLYRRRFGRTKWELHPSGYHKVYDLDVQKEAEAIIKAIPF